MSLSYSTTAEGETLRNRNDQLHFADKSWCDGTASSISVRPIGEPQQKCRRQNGRITGNKTGSVSQENVI